MAVNNGTILARAWLDGTNDFQQRVPKPTQSNIAQVAEQIFNPMNGICYNYFQDYLVNRIAQTVVEGKRFRNPLAALKKDKIVYGSSIEHVALEWLKAHSFEDDVETLLKNNRPKGVSWFASQNRRDRYDVTINRDELRSAFDSEFGLNSLAARIIELPVNSDEYDEFQIMKNLLATYETKWGFTRHKLSKKPVDEASGKEFLTAVMTDSKLMEFPSTTYNAMNAAAIPTFVKQNELILIVDAQTNASIKVNTYAGLFNMSEAEVQARIIVVDHIPIPNAVAVLTTEDALDVHDTEYGIQSFYNPMTLGTNYYLHHWGIYAVNPYVPAVLYTTGDAVAPQTITEDVTGITATLPAKISLGGTYDLAVKLTGTVTPDNTPIELKPDSVTTTSLSLENAVGDTVSALTSRTWIDGAGVLHVQPNGIKAGTKLHVTVKSTYANPTGDTESLTATATTTFE